MQQLIYDLLKVTEKAAISTMPWIGTGNKIEADRAATESMRWNLNKLNMDATVVIGEGELDEAPMLYIGEKLGSGKGPKIDIAVDPIDGTFSITNGKNDAITLLAAAPRGTLLNAPDMYMKKIAVGPKGVGAIDIEATVEENLLNVAKALNKEIFELRVAIQFKERHQEMIEIVRKMGAKAIVFDDGDVIPAITTCLDGYEIDLFMGTGGAPEGVVAAVALKALGGEMQGKLIPQNELELIRCKEMGIHNVSAPLSHTQLVGSNEGIFVATSITKNPLLNGLKRNGNKVTTNSIVIYGDDRKIMFVESVHS